MRIQVSLIVDIDANTTLSSMEEQIQAAGHRWMGEALKQTIRQWEKHHQECPHCGSRQVRLEGTVSRTLLALFGKVCLARQRMRCQQCFRRFLPSAALLQDLHRGRVTPGLLDASVLAGASWPYRQAAQMLARLSGACISAEEMRLVTNRSGREVARQEEQASQSLAPPVEVASSAESEAAPAAADRTIIGMDGGWVPNREQRGGVEGKVAVIASQKVLLRPAVLPDKNATWYELEKYLRRHRRRSVARFRFAKRRYVATFAPASSLGRQAAHAVVALGLSPQEQVVVADGAEWIKQQAQQHFPEATCILDWPHLWRCVAKAVRAVGSHQQRSGSWVSLQFSRLGTWLWKGEVHKARTLLHQWQAEPSGTSIEALKNAIAYLSTQQDWIGSYEQWKKEGYPIGSGVMERAVAVVINRRMKKRGMSWLRPNATAVVALRAAFLNEDWALPATARAFP